MPRLTMRPCPQEESNLSTDSRGRQSLCRHPQLSTPPEGNLDVDCRCPVSPIRYAPSAARRDVPRKSDSTQLGAVPRRSLGSDLRRFPVSMGTGLLP